MPTHPTLGQLEKANAEGDGGYAQGSNMRKGERRKWSEKLMTTKSIDKGAVSPSLRTSNFCFVSLVYFSLLFSTSIFFQFFP